MLPNSLIHHLKPYLLLVLILSLMGVLLFRLGTWGLTETSEARYAEISREMLDSKDIIHPTLLGIGHYHKPPLTYAVTAFAYKIWGASPWAARILLQISLLLQVYLVFKIGMLLFANHKTALIAAIIYSGIPAVLVATRALTTDNYLCTFVLASIYGWLRYRSSGKWVWIYFFYGCLAGGFLTKGPLVFIVPLIVVLTYKKSSMENPWTAHHILAPFCALLAGGSWYIVLIMENYQFWEYFVVDHTLGRFSNPKLFNRSQPVWYYLLVVPLTSFPWFLLVIKSFSSYIIKEQRSEVLRLLGLWIALPMLFFSISSSKLFLYVLPIYAGIALAAAHYTAKLQRPQLLFWSTFQRIFQASLLIILLLLPIVAGSFEISLQIALVLIATLILIGFIEFFWYEKPKVRLIVSNVLFTWMLVVLTTYIFSQNPLMINSTEPLADFIYSQQLQEAQIVVYNRRLPSLMFSLEKPLVFIADGHHSLDREVQFEENESWRHHLINITHPEGNLVLAKKLTKESVFIYKGELSKKRAWVEALYANKKQIGSWHILYY